MTKHARTLLPLLAAALLGSAPAHADEVAGEAHAKELFEVGKRRMDAQDMSGALQAFQASRAALIGIGNTWNAVRCLSQLERWDEALELAHELLGIVREPKDQDFVKGWMEANRWRVGWLDLRADAGAQLIVDGRLRKTFPLAEPLPLLPGKHALRVAREGHTPYETTLEVAREQTLRFGTKLEPLTHTGRVRVEADPRGGPPAAAKLWIDGSPVDAGLPWEGNLAPGRHVLFASAGDIGTDLVHVEVVEGKLATLTLGGRQLGATLRLRIDPPTARLFIDGIDLGSGGFDGRLPVGDHAVLAREEGFVTSKLTLRSTSERGEDQRVKLRVDPWHPRWRGGVRIRVEALGGPLFATSLRSGAEESGHGGVAIGALTAGRISVELPFRLAIDITAGWLVLGRRVDRTTTTSFPAGQETVTVRWDTEDALRVRGPIFGLGLRQRVPFAHNRFDVRFGLGAAVGVLSAQDRSTTTATAGGRTTAASTGENGSPTRTATVLLIPEIDARARLGAVELGVGIGVLAALLEGRALENGETRVDGCPHTAPADVRCLPGTNLLARERSFGQLVAWSPHVTLGWSF